MEMERQACRVHSQTPHRQANKPCKMPPLPSGPVCQARPRLQELSEVNTDML